MRKYKGNNAAERQVKARTVRTVHTYIYTAARREVNKEKPGKLASQQRAANLD